MLNDINIIISPLMVCEKRLSKKKGGKCNKDKQFGL